MRLHYVVIFVTLGFFALYNFVADVFVWSSWPLTISRPVVTVLWGAASFLLITGWLLYEARYEALLGPDQARIIGPHHPLRAWCGAALMCVGALLFVYLLYRLW